RAPSIGAALRGLKNAGIVPAAVIRDPSPQIDVQSAAFNRHRPIQSMEELMKRRILPQLVAASVACLLAGAVNAAGVLAPDSDEDDLVPNGKGWGERAYPAHPNGYGNGNANGQGTRKVGSGINYHGGPVMLGTT